MLKRIPSLLPETLAFVLLGFFALRELGTFPALAGDDALFTIVAKSWASGKGYALPILHSVWKYPYILGVGPTLILPAGLAIKFFGFSIGIARIPQVLFLIGTALTFLFLARRTAGHASAAWSLLLLVTLSAFVNTGKVLMGEIPGFLFLLLGILAFPRARDYWLWTVAAGIVFGLAVLTKITYGLVYPALACALLLSLLRREWMVAVRIALIGVIALAIFLPWRMLEASAQGGLLGEFRFLLSAPEQGVTLGPVLLRPSVLLRLPFLTYGFFLVTGALGFIHTRRSLDRTSATIISTLIALFTIYFLSSFGWYRHLLPAHLLLLLFVPVGIRVLAGKRIAAGLLLLIAAVQGYWQYDHRGSPRGTEMREAAAILEAQYKDQALIIQQAELFALLPENPQWRFLPNPKIIERIPKKYTEKDTEERCAPVVRKLGDAERDAHFGDLIKITTQIFIVPPSDCPR